MSDTAKITQPKKCDFECPLDAEYDFKTSGGPWANGCRVHYLQHRMFTTLGTGKGQRLVLVQ
jgi:hypothetical protein